MLIDPQNGIVAAPTQPHAASDVVDRAVQLADAFRTHDPPVVLVRVTAAADGSDATRGRTETGGGAGARPEGWDVIVEELSGHPGDIVVTTLATDAMSDREPEAHHNSIERIFPRLGERGHTAEIIALLDSSHA